MAKRASRRAMVRRESIRRGVTWAPTIPMAQRELRRTRVRRYRRHRQDVLIAILVVSLLLGTAVYYFGFDIVLMRGAGMSPTLRSGDRVLCIKQSLLDALQDTACEVVVSVSPCTAEGAAASELRSALEAGDDSVKDTGCFLLSSLRGANSSALLKTALSPLRFLVGRRDLPCRGPVGIRIHGAAVRSHCRRSSHGPYCCSAH